MFKGLSRLIFEALHMPYKITLLNVFLSVALVLNRASERAPFFSVSFTFTIHFLLFPVNINGWIRVVSVTPVYIHRRRKNLISISEWWRLLRSKVIIWFCDSVNKSDAAYQCVASWPQINMWNFLLGPKSTEPDARIFVLRWTFELQSYAKYR